MDWLGQCQDNVTEWDIRRPGFTIGQHYNVAISGALSHVDAHPDMTLDVAPKTNQPKLQNPTNEKSLQLTNLMGYVLF